MFFLITCEELQNQVLINLAIYGQPYTSVTDIDIDGYALDFFNTARMGLLSLFRVFLNLRQG